MSALGGDLNRSTQHFVLKGRDGVSGGKPRILSRFYCDREDGAVGSLAARGVAVGRGLAVFGPAIDADGAEAPPDLHRLAEARQAARQRRDVGEADRLRSEIDGLGWDVQDVAGDAFRLVRKTY